MDIETLNIPGLILVTPKRHRDSRGYFQETWHRRVFAEAGITAEFVQDNFSRSEPAGVLRGLHFQIPPFAQAKLLRVLRGAIYDVAVDIRRGSASYGSWAAVTLDAATGTQFYIPAGFAHGFCTLEPGTEVAYKVSAHYSAAHDKGLLWSDPALDIPWPIDAGDLLLSDKDRAHPTLEALPRYFE
jgi:dTDP-4-dehydrorhamnose 3,5-epimerase